MADSLIQPTLKDAADVKAHLISTGEWNNLSADKQTRVNETIIKNEETYARTEKIVTEGEAQLYQAEHGGSLENAKEKVAEVKKEETSYYNQSEQGDKYFATSESATADEGYVSSNANDEKQINNQIAETKKEETGDASLAERYAKEDREKAEVGNTEDTVVKSQTSEAKSSVKRKPPGENVLYDFEPSIYEFTLSAMPASYYNNSEFEKASSRNIIAKSSGLPGQSGIDVVGEEGGQTLAPGTQLNKHFGTVTLKSVIGLNSKTNVSNIHNVEFQMFEPFGVSLLDDLHDAAVNVGYSNYLRACYLLTLKFRGMDDEGKANPGQSIYANQIEKATRYFPIKIVNCDFNVSASGATYNFQAVPWNMNSMNDNKQKLHSPINIHGNTVKTMLKSLQNQLNNQDHIVQQQKDGRNPDLYRIGTLTSPIDITFANKKHGTDLLNATINHSFFTSQANTTHLELNDEGQKAANQVNYDEAMTTMADIDAAVEEQRTKILAIPDYTYRVFTFNRGTSILSIIQAIIDSSSYITRQTESDEIFATGIDGQGRVPWYNIEYNYKFESLTDNATNYFEFIPYAYMVDHYVAIQNSRLKYKINKKSFGRSYDYIYTGANKDILNFDLQFNFAFFQAVAAQRDTTKGLDDAAIKSAPKQNMVSMPGGRGDAGSVPIETEQTEDASGLDTDGVESGEVQGSKALSVIRHTLSNPAADLINLELEILGDPYYLQQLDFRPDNLSIDKVNSQTLSDGSIDTKSGEVYINVNVKTPVDYDDETGRYGNLTGSGKYSSVFFGGVYKLIQIESTFDGGQFTQRLNGVRLKNQQLDQPVDAKVIYKSSAEIGSTDEVGTGSFLETDNSKAEATIINHDRMDIF